MGFLVGAEEVQAQPRGLKAPLVSKCQPDERETCFQVETWFFTELAALHPGKLCARPHRRPGAPLLHLPGKTGGGSSVLLE